MLADENAQTLSKLGLTFLQAKIYLTFVQTGKASANTISKIARIDRSDTYKIILQLQNKGLVEQIIGVPNLYEAVTLNEVIGTLLKRRKQEQHEIEKALRKLTKSLIINKADLCVKIEEPKFLMIPEHETLLKKIKIEFDKVEREVIIITMWAWVEPSIKYFFNSYDKALKRGIKLRMLVQKSDEKIILPKIARMLLRNSNLEIRFSEYEPAFLSSFDKNALIVRVNSNLSFASSPALWTNHAGFVEVFQEHFEKAWNKAKSLDLSCNASLIQR